MCSSRFVGLVCHRSFLRGPGLALEEWKDNTSTNADIVSDVEVALERHGRTSVPTVSTCPGNE
jgi:hypothetical protein